MQPDISLTLYVSGEVSLTRLTQFNQGITNTTLPDQNTAVRHGSDIYIYIQCIIYISCIPCSVLYVHNMTGQEGGMWMKLDQNQNQQIDCGATL